MLEFSNSRPKPLDVGGSRSLSDHLACCMFTEPKYSIPGVAAASVLNQVTFLGQRSRRTFFILMTSSKERHTLRSYEQLSFSCEYADSICARMSWFILCNHGPDPLPRVLSIYFKVLSCRSHGFDGHCLTKAYSGVKNRGRTVVPDERQTNVRCFGWAEVKSKS